MTRCILKAAGVAEADMEETLRKTTIVWDYSHIIQLIFKHPLEKCLGILAAETKVGRIVTYLLHPAMFPIPSTSIHSNR